MTIVFTAGFSGLVQTYLMFEMSFPINKIPQFTQWRIIYIKKAFILFGFSDMFCFIKQKNVYFTKTRLRCGTEMSRATVIPTNCPM